MTTTTRTHGGITVIAQTDSGQVVYRRKLDGYLSSEGLGIAIHGALYDFSGFRCQVIHA